MGYFYLVTRGGFPSSLIIVRAIFGPLTGMLISLLGCILSSPANADIAVGMGLIWLPLACPRPIFFVDLLYVYSYFLELAY